MILHDAIIASITVLKEEHILRVDFASVDVYESDVFVDQYRARLTLINFEQIVLSGLWNGECWVDDGLIVEQKYRSVGLMKLLGKRQRIKKLIIDIISQATLLVDTTEVEFEVFVPVDDQ